MQPLWYVIVDDRGCPRIGGDGKIHPGMPCCADQADGGPYLELMDLASSEKASKDPKGASTGLNRLPLRRGTVATYEDCLSCWLLHNNPLVNVSLAHIRVSVLHSSTLARVVR